MALGNKAVAYNTGIPANVRILCYARCSTQTLFFVTPYQSGGTWWFKINSSKAVSGTFYFFTNEIPPSSGGWGLDMFNASGQRVYSTSTKPLQNLQTSLSRNGVKTFQAGFPTAANSDALRVLGAAHQRRAGGAAFRCCAMCDRKPARSYSRGDRDYALIARV